MHELQIGLDWKKGGGEIRFRDIHDYFCLKPVHKYTWEQKPFKDMGEIVGITSFEVLKTKVCLNQTLTENWK